jgi:AraC family transcriptional regulator
MDESLIIALETPRSVERGPLLLAGARVRYPMTEQSLPAVAEQWARFGAVIPTVPGLTGAGAYGLFWNMFGGGASFEQMTAVEVERLSGLPDSLATMTVPASHYVVFAHPHHVSKLRNTVNTIWHKWLPDSGHVPVGGDVPEFIEWYGQDFDPMTGSGTMEVWIPVKG